MRHFTSIVVGMAITSAFVAGRAHAAAQDAEAQELADQAIFTDYLQLDFKAGEKKLQQAIRLCEKGSCSPTVQAQVYRDLAVIYITGMKRPDDGRQLLVKALQLDPRIALDADLTTPDLVRVFEEAQAEVTRQEQQAREDVAAAKAAPKREAPRKAKPAAEPTPAPVAEAGSVVGSMDDASVDCPPDFPGCDAIQEKSEPEESGSADLGIVNWLSAGLQQDFLMFSGESGVCTAGAPEALSCFRANDTFRDPAAIGTAGDGGEVAGGFSFGTTRLLLGYDRVLTSWLSVGGRLGYAIGGGPAEPGGSAFFPVHIEARGTYWFRPLAIGVLRPFATLGGGFAQVDASVNTQVVDRCPPGGIPDTCTAGQTAVSRVTVWKKTGTSFASLGAGAMYPLNDHGGITAELKGAFLFPSSGMSVSLQAGYTHGF